MVVARTDEHIYDKNKRLKKELARMTEERLVKKGHSVLLDKET